MRPGWNPTRRNRNIGTGKQGLGRDNRLVIPRRSNNLFFYEELIEYSHVVCKVRSWPLRFIVEATRADCAHACTIDDIVRMLRYIPVDDLEGIELVVLRQPKRKEEILRPCWGRLSTDARVGRWAGPAIFLEAVELEKPIRWPKAVTPEDARELERIRNAGITIETTKRHHLIKPTLASVRAVQLYHTLPHEIGHWVQWVKLVKKPALAKHQSKNDLSARYRRIPHVDRESFAHRYADSLRKKLFAAGSLPFKRQASRKRLVKQGLSSEDFGMTDVADDG